MNSAAIQYIWQAIQESERSDDLPFIEELLRRMPLTRSEGLSSEAPALVVPDPLPSNNDPLPTLIQPPLVQP